MSNIWSCLSPMIVNVIGQTLSVLTVKMSAYFDVSTRLSANPHLYDYLHFLHFEPDGSVRMVDGGGQVINTSSCGRYQISQNDGSFDIHFSNLIQTNPFEKDKIIAQIDDFSVSCQKQNGLFAFRQDVVWQIKDETKWPCLLYRSRYAFSVDPLEFGNTNQEGNLYFLLKNLKRQNFRNATRYYYAMCDAQEFPADELGQLVAQSKDEVCWPAQDAT